MQGEPAARMPGIVEVTTPATPGSSLKTPSTPRIDISRASSSSHHEDSNSRDSTPERELLAGGEPPAGCKLTLGYKEDAQDLRSSTEELDLQDPIHEQDLRRESKKLAKRRKEDGSLSDYSGKQLDRERKDSNCSEIVLLNISGRTSRLSSVGSQGSGASGKLSVVSATSSRSPSPHKCLLETSFCGSKPTLADNLIEPSKPETDDLEKILLKREADTTKALIPESIKVSMVDGNLKPDPLDKPRRRGREERKEIFKREVEITKRFLEKVNIEVPILRKPVDAQSSATTPEERVRSLIQEVQKPASLDFNDKRKKTQNFKEIVQTTPTSSSVTGSPKLPRHQKVRDLEGSRTPSPSSVSRKSSFASLFKARTDSSVLSPESPSPNAKPRRSLTSKIKDTTESLRSRSKSRERVSADSSRASSLKKDSKNKGVFSSTLSLFKKRERKKSYDEAIAAASGTIDLADSGEHPSLESIGNVEFRFNADKESRQDDSIFISLHADDRNYEEALPSESVSIPLETPTKLLDEYESEPCTGSIVTEVSIEHHPVPSKIKTEAQIETTSRAYSRDSQISQSLSKESEISKSSSKDSKLGGHGRVAEGSVRPSSSSSLDSKPPEHRVSSSSSKDSIGKKEVTKPKRKSKEVQQIEPPERIDEDGQRQRQTKEQAQNRDIRKSELLDDGLRPEDGLAKAPSVISDLDHNSSESERDSEIEFIRNKVEKLAQELPDERKGLFYEESFEEDLPYVPTTLPLEKSVAMPILPVKQRLQEVRTIPTERPRSTTPINPTLLDEFVMQTSLDERRIEKMKISLPREDSRKLKSPRKHAANTFSEFAGKVPDGGRKGAGKSPSPPPLPPRAPARPTNWINFEEIPEKRKAPKKIQTIPKADDEPKSGGYSYVQPEECSLARTTSLQSYRTTFQKHPAYTYALTAINRCECHEESRRATMREAAATTRTSSSCSSNGERSCNGDNCTVPGTGSVDRASIVSDSSLECSLSIEEGTQTLLADSSSKPFGMDLDVRSNRSSIVSQDESDEIQHQ
ncbi:uncharacterized protein LOC128887166 isoform X2 [Hylaeus anthracinus]|uniref:uncharacterized protein LOC128887166 isoform X2 n=1 Tax=Hylaeus anthracinus TaxID=313031 RepID=UPI0023B89DA5|nr:uncharacterized protein LOC128887166 isoform X2 [Hylaeus anthracinus]